MDALRTELPAADDPLPPAPPVPVDRLPPPTAESVPPAWTRVPPGRDLPTTGPARGGRRRRRWRRPAAFLTVAVVAALIGAAVGWFAGASRRDDLTAQRDVAVAQRDALRDEVDVLTAARADASAVAEACSTAVVDAQDLVALWSDVFDDLVRYYESENGSTEEAEIIDHIDVQFGEMVDQGSALDRSIGECLGS